MYLSQSHVPILLALLIWSSTSSVVMAVGEPEGSIPRPEHPRPQAKRAQWLNLNGVWEFAETDDDADESYLTAQAYPDRITVPFCRESKLSGLQRRGFVRNVWYRRSVEIPVDWRSPRVRLHVGACDWATRVWVNGQLVGRHRGGNVAFAFDVTGALKTGSNVIIIHARDDTRSGKQALGKQSTRPESHGIFYTRTTGIWQTVWLEGVGASFIRHHRVIPDPENSRVLLGVQVDGLWQGLTITAAASADGKPVGTASTSAAGRNSQLVLDLTARHLWSPANPFLYHLTLTLSRDEEVLDRLESYFGLRSVSVEGAAILINGHAIFQRLVLDQGFYPDGVWTAPGDSDLKRDITMSQALGFNGARLHQKVFEPRFLYWADKLGYLVWGEFPSFGANYADAEVNLPIIDEWGEIVRRDYNHPSIIGWCPFNETPPEAGELQNAVVRLTRSVDPTRPVLDTSGWTHSICDPELLDAHDYNQDPESFRARWFGPFGDANLPARYARKPRGIPFFVSEYGGIGWDIGKGWGYGNTPKSMDEFYARYAGLTHALLDNRFMFGFCYTQLTDVEQERNGLYTFDRKPKFDAARLHAINSRRAGYENDPPVKPAASPVRWRVLVGAFPDGDLAREWCFVTEPPGNGWHDPGFDDASWQRGRGGFGKKGGWENRIRTTWTGKDIWLRQEFSYDGSAFDFAALVIHHDDATEVYLNGQPIWSARRWNDDYAVFDVTEALRAALRPGDNVVAIHCHQDQGGQYVDSALLVGINGS